MKSIKSSSKTGKYYLNCYENAKYYDIWDAYKKPSREKISAWRDCYAKSEQESGEGLAIISKTFTRFTAAWRTENGLRVETAENSYLIV